MDPPLGGGDAVRIELSGAHFEFKGYFGRPAALAAGADFVRHPIPQDAWKAATLSAAGGTLSLKVVVAVDCCDYPKCQCINGHCALWEIN